MSTEAVREQGAFIEWEYSVKRAFVCRRDARPGGSLIGRAKECAVLPCDIERSTRAATDTVEVIVIVEDFAALPRFSAIGGGDEKAVGADGNGVLSVDRQNIEK